MNARFDAIHTHDTTMYVYIHVYTRTYVHVRTVYLTLGLSGLLGYETRVLSLLSRRCSHQEPVCGPIHANKPRVTLT